MPNYEETITLKYVIDASDVKKSAEETARQANRQSSRSSSSGSSSSQSTGRPSSEERKATADADRERRRAAKEEAAERKRQDKAEERERKRQEKENAEEAKRKKKEEDKANHLYNHPVFRTGSVLQNIGRMAGMPSLYRIGQMAHMAARFHYGAAQAQNFFGAGQSAGQPPGTVSSSVRVTGGTARAPGGGLPVSRIAGAGGGAGAGGVGGAGAGGVGGAGAGGVGGAGAGGVGGAVAGGVGGGEGTSLAVSEAAGAGGMGALAAIGLVAGAVVISLKALQNQFEHFGAAVKGAAESTFHGNASGMAHAGIHAAQAGSYVAGPILGLILDPLIGQFHKLVDVMDDTVNRLAKYNGAASAAEAQLEVSTLQYNIRMSKAMEPAMVQWDRVKIALLQGMEKLMPVFDDIGGALGDFFKEIKDGVYGITELVQSIALLTHTLNLQFTQASKDWDALMKTEKERQNPNSLVQGGGAIPGAGITAVSRATGGPIFSARGTDVVPAMLTPGEYIVDAKTTSKFLPELQRMKYMSRGGKIHNGMAFGSSEVDDGGASGIAGYAGYANIVARNMNRRREPTDISRYADLYAATKNSRQIDDATGLPEYDANREIAGLNKKPNEIQREYNAGQTVAHYGLGQKGVYENSKDPGLAELHAQQHLAQQNAQQKLEVPLQIPMPQITQRVNFDLAMTLQHEQAVHDAINQIRSTLLNGISTTRDEVWLLGNMVNASMQVALDQM